MTFHELPGIHRSMIRRNAVLHPWARQMAAKTADLGKYVGGMWQCRYFWLSLVRTDLRLRYRRSVLGIAWSLLNPLLMTAILCFVFKTMFEQSLSDYAPFVLVGLAFWSFVSTTILQGCHSLPMGEPYIRQYPAPMAIYPLRTVLSSLFHFSLALCVAVMMTWAFRGFGNIGALWSLVPATILLALVGWALAVLVGFAAVYFPDTVHLSEVGLQFCFYLTPIIYPPNAGGDRMEKIRWVLALNPFAWLVQLFREPILYGRLPPWQTLLVANLAAALLVSLAVAVLAKFERRVIFQL